MPTYTMVDGVQRELTSWPAMVDGVSRELGSMVSAVDGVQREIFSAGTPLGSLTEGSIIQLNENNVPVDFYVTCHNYERELNGSGRTLLVRKDCYDAREWHSFTVNAWASCTLRSWLNGDYLNMLDAKIRVAIGATKYYYTIGNGDATVTTRSDAVFQLSVTELGKTATYANAEGTALPIASTLQIAYIDGSARSQWTRSPRTRGTGGAYRFDPNGDVDDSFACTYNFGSRPVFTLPSTFII